MYVMFFYEFVSVFRDSETLDVLQRETSHVTKR